MKKHHSIALFLLAYAGLLLVYWLCDYFGWPSMLGSLLPIALMVFLIIRQQKAQDEVMQKVSNQAYVFAFWATFLALIALASPSLAADPVIKQWPLWTVPLLAWHVGYLIAWIKHT
ncbi:hypothetical protein [Marinicella meishanensis]|uniref:hypothetical protein n=1 Tax=Marinicella meishanensis TaxID=2873263 RepID=UPI001CBCDD34|nr:hypothetical protein [Marinicella sp. NBU2979]